MFVEDIKIWDFTHCVLTFAISTVRHECEAHLTSARETSRRVHTQHLTPAVVLRAFIDI